MLLLLLLFLLLLLCSFCCCSDCCCCCCSCGIAQAPLILMMVLLPLSALCAAYLCCCPILWQAYVLLITAIPTLLEWIKCNCCTIMGTIMTETQICRCQFHCPQTVARHCASHCRLHSQEHCSHPAQHCSCCYCHGYFAFVSTTAMIHEAVGGHSHF